MITATDTLFPVPVLLEIEPWLTIYFAYNRNMIDVYKRQRVDCQTDWKLFRSRGKCRVEYYDAPPHRALDRGNIKNATG